jgi:pyruvate carboxylase subunit B
MRREFIATTEDGELVITVELDDKDRDEHLWRVTLGERTLVVDARAVRAGTWSLLVDGRSYVIDLDERNRGLAVLTGTSEAIIELEDARRKRLAQAVRGNDRQASGEIIRAPIAGKVVKLLVDVADEVTHGQSVAVLEAMKMENEIKAESGGTVAAVHVAAGQSVDTGEPLVTLT